MARWRFRAGSAAASTRSSWSGGLARRQARWPSSAHLPSTWGPRAAQKATDSSNLGDSMYRWSNPLIPIAFLLVEAGRDSTRRLVVPPGNFWGFPVDPGWRAPPTGRKAQMREPHRLGSGACKRPRLSAGRPGGEDGAATLDPAGVTPGAAGRAERRGH